MRAVAVAAEAALEEAGEMAGAAAEEADRSGSEGDSPRAGSRLNESCSVCGGVGGRREGGSACYCFRAFGIPERLA